MNARKRILVLVALVLAGCAGGEVRQWLGMESRSPRCTLPQCNYKITVESCSKDGIKPEYDHIHVDKGTHRIHWVITSPGYEFATNGVAFPGNPREFSNGTRVTPKEFSWTDTNDSPQGAPAKSFKYDIRIVDSAGRTCLHDPYVVNE